MANIDRFMIAPINSGQQGDTRSWLLPEDAFSKLLNAYVFRGRVRKRTGSLVMNTLVDQKYQQNYTRLRINVGTTAAITGNFNAIMPGTIWKPGQMFSVDDWVFTAYQVNGDTYTTSISDATYNTATGALAITGNNFNPNSIVYFYPSTPVMGITQYIDVSLANDPTIAFDQQFAYQYNGSSWQRIGAAVWTGTDSSFFWATNWRGVDAQDYILFVVNSTPADGIKYWNSIVWTTMKPQVNTGGTTLESAVIIVAFKDRLICLNTWEKTGATTSQFGNRCRFSQNGTPLISADVNAWREDIPGKGGFLDAPTKEQIVSCGFVKDRLIVYFEKSTWELSYTQNQVLPFVWQRLNSELGAESTFSAVPFDKVVLGIGSNGIHACNGSNVDRIDQKIPDEVFQISNQNEGIYRVCGIRDYFMQLAYWAFPDQVSKTYPNMMLVYNYLNGTWAQFEDGITAFGYYQPQSNLTWASWTSTWGESLAPWNSGQNELLYKEVLCGNQEGFTFRIAPDQAMNASVLQITNIVPSVIVGWMELTIINHSLSGDQYIYIQNVVGIPQLNDKIYEVVTIDQNTIRVYEPSSTGTYLGAGTVARVSNIDIVTKEYNFYVDKGRNAYISKVDFYVDSTVNGQVTVNCFIGSASGYNITTEAQPDVLPGMVGILETFPYSFIPMEEFMTQLWHPVYPMAEGESVQLQITMNDAQITNSTIAFEDFQMHAMTFYTTPTASRLQ